MLAVDQQGKALKTKPFPFGAGMGLRFWRSPLPFSKGETSKTTMLKPEFTDCCSNVNPMLNIESTIAKRFSKR